MTNKNQTENTIIKVAQGVGLAYQERNLVEAMCRFSTMRQVVVYGNSKKDRRIGRDQLEDQIRSDFMKHPNGYGMVLSNILVDWENDVAWLSADCDNVDADGTVMKNARLSVVLVKEQEEWKIVQWHKSRPDDWHVQ